jgi:hypothetical protein
MSRPSTKNAIIDDGLRYKSKVSGSQFASTAYAGGSTMSCFLCGKHQPRSQMTTRKFIGKSHAVCAPKCE